MEGLRNERIFPRATVRQALWGHLQEAALARIGMEFGRDDLVRAAARSADAVLAPAARDAFPGPRSLPFDVSSTVAGLDAVAAGE